MHRIKQEKNRSSIQHNNMFIFRLISLQKKFVDYIMSVMLSLSQHLKRKREEDRNGNISTINIIPNLIDVNLTYG
jgi:hypothetical protein